ncbi:unnamed protein product [Lactuca virosa]|uniref:Uncharacterized protein n=1 Tax=Lactuca virosa TaxID=75947 RepID=A0AAU9P8E2_9ASTR|nr:unnamed protein product [Lactuca virosa]
MGDNNCAFQATQSTLPLIPAPRIVQINEGSPTRKPNEIPEEPLIPPPSELFINESGHQIISFIFEKGNNSQAKAKRLLQIRTAQ